MKRPVKQTTERRIAAGLRIALAVALLAANIAAVLLLCCLALILSDRPGRRKAPRPFSAR